MIQGIKKKNIRENRTAKSIVVVPDMVYDVSERLHSNLTELKLTTSTIKDLTVVLHNKLAFLRPVRNRENTLWGRWLNKLKLEDPHHVDLNGIELKTLLALTEETADIEIEYSSKQMYSVPYNEVNSMYETLKEIIEMEKVILNQGKSSKALS